MDSFSRNNSFMDDGDGLGLGDDLFGDDSGDLGRIFDDDEDGRDQQPFDDSDKHQNLVKEEHIENALDENDGNATGDKEQTSQEMKNEDVKNEDDNDQTEKSKKKKRRRSSAASVEGDHAGPPPAWHSEAADKPHREAMTVQIAQLLKARKKTAPTKEWMQQLPHKARVLEERLYRKATSLEAYLNQATLKNRLRTLAVTITAHYKKAVKTTKSSKRGSVNSTDSTNASHRDSMSSMSQLPMDAQLMSGGGGLGPQDASPALTGSGNGAMNQKVVPPEVAMSELARQKAVNEQLQQQILENIRQQQQLVHKIRRGSNEMPGNMQGSTSMAGNSGNASSNNMNPQLPNMPGQFNNMQQNMNQMQAAMAGNNVQGNQFANNGQGNAINQRGSNASSMANAAFEAQTSLMRHQSAPTGNPTQPNAGQMALMRQHSASAQTGMDMQNANMQANMNRRSSSTGPPSHGANAAQAQFHAQQTNLMRQNSNAQTQNQAAQAQMQAALLRQASGGGNQFNMAQAQAMMNPQAAAQAQAALMRQASAGAIQMNGQAAAFMGGMPGGAMMGNAGMMNQQMGNNAGNGGMPNGQMMPGFGANQQMMQANPAMMQQMNAMGMQQNMAQFAGMQQQMGMATHGRNSMMSVGNDGNAMDNMNFPGKKTGDDMGLSQNSFGW